jgi:hypothetical protein
VSLVFLMRRPHRRHYFEVRSLAACGAATGVSVAGVPDYQVMPASDRD